MSKGLVPRMYISDLFEAAAEQFPDNDAVICDGKIISYCLLNKISNQVGRALKDRVGVSSGDIIAVKVDKKSIHLVAFILGALKVGASYLLIPTNKPAKEGIDPDHIFCDLGDDHLSIYEIVSDSKREVCDPIPKVEISNQPARAYSVLTSGSTGKPKMVSISHANILATFNSWLKVYELNPSDTHLQMASPSFDVFTGDWVRALCSGGTLVLCQKKTLLDPRRLLSLINQNRPSIAEFVPSTLRILMDNMECRDGSFDCFRLLIIGSDIWYMHECDRLARLCPSSTRIVNSYGVSEATIDSTFFEYFPGYSGVNKSSMVPIGKPFPHVYLKVVDDEGEELVNGEIGKLIVGGEGVSDYDYREYQGSASGFSEAGKEREYNTNDIVRVMEDANVLFLGRNEEQFNVNGERINFLYIESLLIDHPKVKTALIIPCVESGRQYLEAYLVLDSPLSRRDIVSYLKSCESVLVIPRYYYQIDKRAVSPNGKILRERGCYANAERIEDDNEIIIEGNTQKVISKIWEDQLGVSPISENDSFCSISGTSLEYAKIVLKVNEIFRVSLPLGLKCRTIREMAYLVDIEESISTDSFHQRILI